MTMLAKVAKITDLSFVESKSNLWEPRRTGDYATDTAIGRAAADELLAFMRLKECPLAYGRIARAITESGRFEGVEVGFCSRIGIQLIVGLAEASASSIVSAAMDSPLGTRSTHTVPPAAPLRL